MYIPTPFVVEDKDTLFDFIEEHSFGILISNSDQVPVATHLPLTLDRENGYLIGHFAKPNPQWTDILNQEVLIIFHGPHSYISSSWYESNQSVPTWNYTAVHAYGEIEYMEDKQELLRTLNDLVTKYESSESSYKIDPSNIAVVEGLMKGIVGFKMKINRLEGKWKLSQNHSKERQERVIHALEQVGTEDAVDIARLMRKNINN
ncbi:FMN-binding negative transcriptional regulator [Caldalkalibacillus mannanilyticus]|uniref:FMN-binding negative transcriptional regulator n=1 Tax=Caldalkalibacillus mannanilyticus TaxID=1418 RepID=UPI000469535E|nr:FMN-binding negative transcriptional regulator [Caldalkalibacillus mannanilyticus]